ncbi:MAG TPA: hypothetical protein VES68_03550 [Candidatus Sulfotelmatobacter sp.]|nr:hypothetical protein [Candidatus Sulfotelmatobacter sp.]
MTERRDGSDLIQDPRYEELVKSIFDSGRTFLKDGLLTKEGRFFPRQHSSPTFIIDFDTNPNQLLFNISDFGGFVESSMTYRIREGHKVSKTGYVEGHSRSLWGLIHYTDETVEELEKATGEKLAEDETISPPQIVEIDELELVSKLIEDPFGNAHLVKELPKLPGF